MAIITGLSSDWTQRQKEYLAQQAGVNRWEDIFLQQYQPISQAVKTQASYDISSAYANYKKSQIGALQNQRLGSGFKEQIASDLASQYQSAYANIRQEELSNLASVEQSYLKTLAEQEKSLASTAEKYANIENLALTFGEDYLSELGVTREDLNDPTKGFIRQLEDGTFERTEEWVDLMDKLLNEGITTTVKDEKTGEDIQKIKQFQDYLLESGEDELYEFYMNNFDTVKQLVGGLEPGDIKYETSERRDRLDANKAETSFKEKYKDLYDDELEFESDVERAKYYKSFESALTDLDSYMTESFKNFKNLPQSVLDVFDGLSLNYSDGTISIGNAYSSLSHSDIRYLESIGFRPNKLNWTLFGADISSMDIDANKLKDAIIQIYKDYKGKFKRQGTPASTTEEVTGD